jgi:hypothetical protein
LCLPQVEIPVVIDWEYKVDVEVSGDLRMVELTTELGWLVLVIG